MKDLSDLDEVESAARDLLARGVGIVVVTLGADGALIVTPESAQHVPGYKVDVVDTTGAGDAFNGALAVALAEGTPLPDAVKFANAAAALQVTKVGTAPAMPYRADVIACWTRPPLESRRPSPRSPRLGLQAGMGVVVHSSLRSLGHVEGGAQTVVEALMEIITPEGTLVMPSFNHDVSIPRGRSRLLPSR